MFRARVQTLGELPGAHAFTMKSTLSHTRYMATKPSNSTDGHFRARTLGGWYFSTILLLLLGAVFPVIFTRLDPTTILRIPVLLSLVVSGWAAIRLVAILSAGVASLVQATFWVFVYVWFGLAAIAQTASQRFPIADQSFSEEAQVKALLAVMVGLAAYELGRVSHRLAGPSHLAPRLGPRQISLERLWVIAGVGAAGTLFALETYGLGVLYSSRYTAAQAVYGQPSPGLRLDEIGNKAVGLLQATFIWAPAFLALYLLVTLLRTPRTRSQERTRRFVSSARGRMLLVGLGVANILVNNPISSPRYRFGGAALAMIAVSWPLFSPRRFRLWTCGIIVAVLFALPVLDIFRYDERRIQIVPLKEQLLTSPDFGMFQQEVNAQVYVEEHGFTFGEQVLGVVFAYVPRALWEGKPRDTGNLIVRSEAINASASLWATVFVDGGFIAVALTFLMYGRLTRLWEDLYIRKWRDSSFVAASVPLYAGFQIILLRGDLQPAVGQLAPLLLMLLFVSRVHRSRVQPPGGEPVPNAVRV